MADYTKMEDDELDRLEGCMWCNMQIGIVRDLYDRIYASNAVEPEYCPWCGRKLSEPAEKEEVK